MRVMFIAPPWLEIYGNYRAAARIGCVAPPLGLAYLAGALKQIGSECRIVDCEMEALSVEALIERIRDFDPGLIGLTATTPVFQNATVLATEIKRAFPDTPLGIGGVHATVAPDNVLSECPAFDFQVVGEAEFTIQEIVRRYESESRSLAGIEGVFYRREPGCEEIVRNPLRTPVEDLDAIPMPARELFQSDLYVHSVPGKEAARYADIFTSRGCPFRCVFCSQHTMYGRRVRWHSIERVMSELRQIVSELGIKHVIFMDETLTLNKPRLRQICQAIRDEGLDFTWEGWTHASTIDEDILRDMQSAGLIRLSFGIESGDPAILKRIKKGVTLEQIREAYRLARKVGIETRGSAMLGHPGETRASAWRTIRFCRSIRECQQIFLNVACPYPGTELYECACQGTDGMKLLSTDYSRYKRYGDPVISVNDLEPNDLKRLQTLGLLYFYLTPARIWHNLVRRAGVRAGLRNAFAFLAGVMRSLSGARR